MNICSESSVWEYIKNLNDKDIFSNSYLSNKSTIVHEKYTLHKPVSESESRRRTSPDLAGKSKHNGWSIPLNRIMKCGSPPPE